VDHDDFRRRHGSLAQANPDEVHPKVAETKHRIVAYKAIRLTYQR
jgi:hypothetical protein